MNRIVFFQTKTPKEKLSRLVETIHLHFKKKEKIILFVEDEKTLAFVDELLWKMPEASFLPHSTTTPSDFVFISKEKKNPQNVSFAFNLSPTPILIDPPFKILYDFEDLSTPHKKQLFTLRFDAYKQAHFIIEAR